MTHSAPLPSFLIIGAMKAGTTSLYEDLSGVKGIYLPPEKEPNDLIHPDVCTPKGRATYGAKFANAPQGALCGEASTAYTKRPTYDGVAERALQVLGPDLKLIYMTRDPIRRIVSQYHHLWGLELEERPLNQAVLEDETYVAYSNYDLQLAPWRATFGTDQVLVIAFEDYIARRPETLARICAFLGVTAPQDVNESHRNASDGKRVVKHGSTWSKIAHSDIYLYRIKPLLPTRLRDRLKRALLPQAKSLDDTLNDTTQRELVRRLESARDDRHVED